MPGGRGGGGGGRRHRYLDWKTTESRVPELRLTCDPEDIAVPLLTVFVRDLDGCPGQTIELLKWERCVTDELDCETDGKNKSDFRYKVSGVNEYQ